MAFRPLHDRVLVRRVETETTSLGGIIIPDSAQEKPQKGVILAVGPGKTEKGSLIAPTVAVGDKVLFGKWSGTEVEVDGEKVLIMKEEDVLGIIG